jgi:hypothetical protein
MDPNGIGQQTRVEHEILKHITRAMRVVMDWEVVGNEFSRKLASLRFLSQSFQRHLERMMAVEEHDGYMSAVAESHPQWSKEVDALRQDHSKFRAAIHWVVPHLERVSPTDLGGFQHICRELHDLLETLDEHSRKEMSLLQKAFLREEGGEG